MKCTTGQRINPCFKVLMTYCPLRFLASLPAENTTSVICWPLEPQYWWVSSCSKLAFFPPRTLKYSNFSAQKKSATHFRKQAETVSSFLERKCSEESADPSWKILKQQILTLQKSTLKNLQPLWKAFSQKTIFFTEMLQTSALIPRATMLIYQCNHGERNINFFITLM